jgi:uncharacterized protein YecT (DUF1311 family)
MKMLALLVLAWSAPALADACDTANTQTDMNQCHGEQAAKSDAELNRVYRALMARWKGDGKTVTLLRDSERAWVAYRKAECDLQALPTIGGSMQPVVITMCFKAMTDDRVKLLKAKLTCQEGDLTCVRPQP